AIEDDKVDDVDRGVGKRAAHVTPELAVELARAALGPTEEEEHVIGCNLGNDVHEVVRTLGADLLELPLDLVEQSVGTAVELEGDPHPPLFAGREVLDEDLRD